MNYNHEQYINNTHFSLQHTTLEDSVSPAILLINPQYDSRSASHLDYTKLAQLAVVSKVCSARFNRMRMALLAVLLLASDPHRFNGSEKLMEHTRMLL